MADEASISASACLPTFKRVAARFASKIALVLRSVATPMASVYNSSASKYFARTNAALPSFLSDSAKASPETSGMGGFGGSGFGDLVLPNAGDSGLERRASLARSEASAAKPSTISISSATPLCRGKARLTTA